MSIQLLTLRFSRLKQTLSAGVVAALMVMAPFAPHGALLPSLGLAASLGLLGALALSVCWEALGAVPARARPLLVPLLGSVMGYLGVAKPLGALSKLEGEHRLLALSCLLGSVVAGGAVAWLVWWVRPMQTTLHPARRAAPVLRWSSAALAFTLALSIAAFEASQATLATYPALQHALVVGAWLCALFAIAWLLAALELPVQQGARVFRVTVGVQVALGAALWFADAERVTRMVKADHTQHWVWIGRTITDWDRDGVSGVLGGGDCKPFDPAVSPLRTEIRGNGVDDNCRHGDAPPMPQLADEAAPQAPQAPERAPSRPPNLVLITIDALRADRTTPYGYTRNTTPHLAEFAQSAVVFDNAYTSGGWTCLALPSLFSGVYPRRLQWKSAAVTSERRVVDFPWQEQLKEGETFLISVTVPRTEPNWWLPDALKTRGYQTLAVLSRSIRQLSERLVDHGWDRVHVPEEATDIAVSRLAIEQLPTLGERPFFMWLHYYDVHYPQTEHPEVPNFGPTLEDKYDHEVASTDLALSKLFGALDALPNSETAIVVTADHGEAFESGRQFHGADLFEEGIRIPLLLRVKGLAAGRVSTPVSLVDIAPTLLALAELKAPRGLDGADLRLARGDRSVVTDLFRVDDAGQPLLDMVAVTNSSQRLARDNLKQVESLVRTHDLQRPPLELELLSAAPELTEALSRYAESAMGL